MTLDQEQLEGELDFYFGSFGGLCGYSDSLSITPDLETFYDLDIFCTDVDFETSQSIDVSEYDALVNSFSLSEFETMRNNSCDRCLDGIDNFLHIVSSDFRHRIVFSHSDNIAAIQNLVDQLENIKDAHQPE